MYIYIGLPILGNGNSLKDDRKFTEREGGGGDEIEIHRRNIQDTPSILWLLLHI